MRVLKCTAVICTGSEIGRSEVAPVLQGQRERYGKGEHWHNGAKSVDALFSALCDDFSGRR